MGLVALKRAESIGEFASRGRYRRFDGQVLSGSLGTSPGPSIINTWPLKGPYFGLRFTF